MEYPKGQGNGVDETAETRDQQASREDAVHYTCSLPIYMAGQISGEQE